MLTRHHEISQFIISFLWIYDNNSISTDQK